VPSRVLRIGPESGRLPEILPIPTLVPRAGFSRAVPTAGCESTFGGTHGGITVGAGGIRFFCGDATFGSVNPASKRIAVAGLVTHGFVTGIAAGPEGVWLTSRDDNSIVQIDPQTGETLQTLTVAASPSSIAEGNGSLWVTGFGAATVTRVDFPGPGASPTVEAIRVGSGPASVAIGEGGVWVANATDSTVSRIDPRTNKVIATIKLGHVVPADIAVGAGKVWVTAQAP